MFGLRERFVMDKKAEHATEVALTALDKLASLVDQGRYWRHVPQVG